MTESFDEAYEQGLTYDDMLLLPRYSQVLPHQTDTSTQFTKNLRLRSPIVSAAMDTVTDAKTAIAMAQNGGIGIVHKNMSPAEQAAAIKKVKKSQSGVVSDPITVGPNASVAEVVHIMQSVGISGLPVVDNGTLVGIVTGRDIRFERNYDRPVREVMNSKVVTAPEGTTTEQAIEILHKHRIEKLPVIGKDGKSLVGLFTIRDIQNAKRHPDASKDGSGRLLVGAAIGAGGDYMERAQALLQEGADVIIIDTAHGHSKGVIEAVKKVRAEYKKFQFDLVAGNVATAEGTLALIEAGVDAVKVGIGPGSICTTRIVAGIGVPQFSAVRDCARAAQKTGTPIIADGGIKFSGDMVKALAVGANSVMIGNLLAGTDEAPGELVIFQGKSFKTYRGMGSLGAMGLGSKDRYMQAEVGDPRKLVPEGIEGRVAYKGPLTNILFQLVGGIRQAMGYIGAPTIKDLQQQAKFIRISSASLKESHVHDVYITREAPNYQLD